MATLQLHQVDDFVKGSYNRALGKKSWVDISLGLQWYTTARRFLTEKKVPIKGSPQIIWDVQVSNNETATWTGLFDQDTFDVGNLLQQGTEDWSHAKANYAYDVREKIFQEGDWATIADHVVAREHSMYNSFYEDVLEPAFWTKPTDSTVTPMPLKGIPYWVVKNATEGFNGADPSGFSSGAGGLATATYAKWKNYTFQYANVTRDDLIKKWIKAVEFCHFQSPHKFPRTDKEAQRFEFYTTYSVMDDLAEFLETRNDNIVDLSGFSEKQVFRGIPVLWVPALTESTFSAYDSTNPIYGIDWNSMKLFFKKGQEMRRTGPEPVAGQHNVRAVHLDSSCGLVCTNRRRNFVGYV